MGHRYRRAGALADDSRVPRVAYVSTEAIGGAEGALVGGLLYVGAAIASGAVVASGGTLATAIVAAVIAGGGAGAFGSILAMRVGHHHARYLDEQVENGGLLLWVHTIDAARERDALQILQKHAADCVHLHAEGSSLPA